MENGSGGDLGKLSPIQLENLRSERRDVCPWPLIEKILQINRTMS